MEMHDRDRIIKGLERISEWLFHQYQVVYDVDAPNYYDAYKTVDDAISALKERETTSTDESRLFFHCEKCGYGLYDIYLSNEYDFDVDPHYCPNCGRYVKRK